MPTSEDIMATQEVEDCLIGSILLESTKGNREVINRVSGIVKPKYFYIEQNGRIYDAMLTCQLPPHQINVAMELHARNILQSGDCSHLYLVTSLVPCSLDYMDYALAVNYYWMKRTGTTGSYIKGVAV